MLLLLVVAVVMVSNFFQQWVRMPHKTTIGEKKYFAQSTSANKHTQLPKTIYIPIGSLIASVVERKEPCEQLRAATTRFGQLRARISGARSAIDGARATDVNAGPFNRGCVERALLRANDLRGKL
jgi:hypothetical protein